MKPDVTTCIQIFITAFALTLPVATVTASDAEKTTAVTPETVTAEAAVTLTDDSLKALSQGEVHTLIRMASLPTEKLVSLRESIERLEKMTPTERRELRKKLEKLRDANNKEREKIAREVNEKRPPRGNILQRYWKSLPPEQCKAEAEKFKKMTDEERRNYVKEVFKKMPPPVREPGKNPSEQNRPHGHSPDKRRDRAQPPPPSPADSTKQV